jgi:glycine/D-amino acid oxidase-like deaminating enzyme
MSRSNAPIAARVPGWQNAYIANGGGSKGLLLSVGIGRAIVELLTNGRTALPAP